VVAICTVDRDFVIVVERALATASVTPTYSPDIDRPSHYRGEVAAEDVDRAQAALLEYGTFKQPEGSA
jgi:hypothetical protein